MTEALMPIEQLITQFNENRGWDKQYRLIIQLGKKLPELDAKKKIEANQVKGCESLAWLVIEQPEQCLHLQMDSDTRVVKGVMMILLVIFQGKTVQQVNKIDIDAIFKKLGILHHLSPSRANGLLAIVDKIKMAGSANE